MHAMVSDPVEGGRKQGEPTANSIWIRLIVADSEPIFRVGMRKIFAIEDDIRVMALAETLAQTEMAVAKYPADVLLFEAALSPNPAESIVSLMQIAPTLRVIAVVADPTGPQTLECVRRGAYGIVPRSISPDVLISCVRKVHKGETWLDHNGISMVIEAYRAQASKLTSPKPKTKLSSKELFIIAGVARGLRNREIAVEVGTTEQVVKNYLRKIYDKVGVTDRLELALYCMHHKLLESSQATPDVSPSAPAALAASAKT